MTSATLQVPLDVWYQILAECPTDSVTLVCRSWTALVYSIPTLWTHLDLTPKKLIHSDCLPFLNDLLPRARKHRLHVSVWDDETINLEIYNAAGALFASHSRIDTLHLDGDSAHRVAHILSQILFRGDATPTTLVGLSLETRYSDEESGRPPSIDIVGRAHLLPDLRSLSLTMMPNFVPISSSHSKFDNLTTLVITEPFFNGGGPSLYALCAWLSCTPQLETFYCKTTDIWNLARVQGLSTITSLTDPQASVPIPIVLPRLTSAAVTVTGLGGDILACIHAPALSDLHLDGSRCALISERDWSDLLHSDFLFTLGTLAQRSPNLRRLALTEAALSQPAWCWLLCGDPLPVTWEEQDNHLQTYIGSGRVPFPLLETLAVRDFSETRSCGLDDAVLKAYDEKPGLASLKRIVLRRCVDISGDVLLEALLSSKRASGGAELELEAVACPGIEEGHRAAMEGAGMQIRWQPDSENLNAEARHAEQLWWESRSELAASTYDYSPEDWEDESEPARDEEPWWIFDLQSLDPTDSRVY